MEYRFGIRHFKDEEREMIRMAVYYAGAISVSTLREQVFVRAVCMRRRREHGALPRVTVQAGVLNEKREDQNQYDNNILVPHENDSMPSGPGCQDRDLIALNSAPTVCSEVRNPVVPANSTFLNPASSISCVWSRTGTVPPTHCDHDSAFPDKPDGSSFSRITSAIWSLPPGFRTR